MVSFFLTKSKTPHAGLSKAGEPYFPRR